MPHLTERVEISAPAQLTILDLARAVYDEATTLTEDEGEREQLALAALWGVLRSATPAPEAAPKRHPSEALHGH